MEDLISMSPQEAYEFLQNDPQAKLIDIRSSMEYLFVGHPVGATHVAWIDEPDWDINPDFIQEVTQATGKKAPEEATDNPLVLICRSGVRTKEAAAVLLEAGFKKIIHINEGFEGDRDENYQRSTLGGWRFRGLPWEQC